MTSVRGDEIGGESVVGGVGLSCILVVRGEHEIHTLKKQFSTRRE